MLAPPDGVCESTEPTRERSVVCSWSVSTSKPADFSCSRPLFCFSPLTSGTYTSCAGSAPVETFS
jgi:hypothetical protein